MPKISDPITIRNMEVKNRFGYPPMVSGSHDSEGRPTEAAFTQYELKAKGGVGIMTYEASQLDTWLRGPGMTGPNIGRAENVPAFKKMTDRLHQHNVKVGMQMNKVGMISYTFGAMANFFGLPSNIGPSSIDLEHATSAWALMVPTWSDTIKNNNLKIKELSVEEIDQIQDLYASGAKNAIDAGFDYVMVHSGHGTLPQSFLTPYFNRRTDKYGGSVEKRCTFIKETVGKIRKSIGDEPPILVRFSADELVHDGNKIENSIEIAQNMEKAGVDCLDITQGIILRSPFGITIPSYCKPGCFIHLPEEIKKHVDIPVMGVGGVNDPRMAAEFIEQEKCDIINMGRQLICDPETPNKYFDGRIDDIKRCLGCLMSCGTCVYDAYSGLNYQELTPSAEKKKIVVIGGGIAGMEAARLAKLRGHEVELYEKSKKLGGLIPLLAKEFGKERYIQISDFLETQLKKLNIPVHLNKEATKDEIAFLNPDILILATGSEATIPVNLKGKANVLTQDESILKNKDLGKDIVVWGLNAYWRGGLESVVSLAEEGYNIKAFIGSEAAVGQVIASAAGRRFWIMRYLRDLKAPIYTNAKLLDVTDEGVKFLDKDKNEQFIEADSLVYCGSRIANGKALSEIFEGVAPEIKLLGDCNRPRDIQAAMTDAQKYIRSLK
ncbi:MAG: FAD-dependent oxidoreductase [Candidatus Lokiarchaeota archaeon]|nr:FAD-dependent oxidoreductase [Candidatus Lokiarchaeota archaeon]